MPESSVKQAGLVLRDLQETTVPHDLAGKWRLGNAQSRLKIELALSTGVCEAGEASPLLLCKASCLSRQRGGERQLPRKGEEVPSSFFLSQDENLV